MKTALPGSKGTGALLRYSRLAKVCTTSILVSRSTALVEATGQIGPRMKRTANDGRGWIIYSIHFILGDELMFQVPAYEHSSSPRSV